MEEGEEIKEDGSMGEYAVPYDEIDSSRTIDEEVGALILQEPSHIGAGLDLDDVHIIGSYVERFTGREFTSCAATREWMEWDATSHM